MINMLCCSIIIDWVIQSQESTKILELEAKKVVMTNEKHYCLKQNVERTVKRVFVFNMNKLMQNHTYSTHFRQTHTIDSGTPKA